MSKLFEGVPQTRVVPDPDARLRSIPGALAQGDAWALFDRGGQFLLEYMSGQVSGRGGSVVVTAEEAARLKSADEETVTSILNAHGCY